MHLRIRIMTWLCLAGLVSVLTPQAEAGLYGLTFDPVSGPGVARFGNDGRFRSTAPAGFESVDGLAVSADGFVYVAGNVLGNGYLVRAPVAPSSGATQWTAAPLRADYNIPGGLVAGPDGAVYATSTAFRSGGVSGVFRYDPASETFAPYITLNDPAPPSGGPRPFNYAVAVSPLGDLYLARRGVGVERYNASGSFVGLVVPWADIGANSIDMDLGPDGNLYIASSQGVDRFDPVSGAALGRFIDNGSGGLGGATSVSFGGDGLLYVNSTATRSVLRYDASTGAFRDVFITPAEQALAGIGLGQIAYAVPEPAALSAGSVLLGVALLRRRRGCPAE